MPQIKKILLFEPWGLGDLIISLFIAKHLKENDVKVELLCSSSWSEWASTLEFISSVYSFNAPWTRKKKKYKITDYLDNGIFDIKKTIKEQNYDLVVDTRGDLRHYLFLKYFLLLNTYSPISSKNVYVYNKPKIILEALGYRDFNYVNKFTCRKNIKNIICFFDASDRNRSVPIAKRIEIVKILLKSGYDVKVISENNYYCEYWKNLSQKNNFSIVFGSVSNVVENIKSVDLCISTDSGWLHVANFYGIKTIALLGFDTRKIWLPPLCEYVFANEYYDAGSRYKKKYQGVQPLSTLNVENIISLIYEMQMP